MITCKECKERLHPEDPGVPTGKYHHSTCDYFCNKPSRFRELEEAKEFTYQPRPIVNVTYKMNDVQTPAFKVLQEQINLVNGRLTKYFDNKKVGKQDRYTKYK